MATLQSHLFYSSKLVHFKNPNSFSFSKKLLLLKKLFLSKNFCGVLSSRVYGYCKASSSSSSNSSSTEIYESVSSEKSEKYENERPPFDINLAVILAGFAFEAYTTPPETVGKREMDAANCQTVFLSQYVTSFCHNYEIRKSKNSFILYIGVENRAFQYFQLGP
ncbi:uncharacterized protein LOC111371122 [Olea europaea var. sylvestris]|uniref:uncharacterized protein LOC111371122 n=1 Tax=Olea europaea var. sylvestris TaxID=158386 RepID=UPI000C1D12AA|nr:uncharacterized protein LOC111371122 [Olea europaea var. sylvestris]